MESGRLETRCLKRSKSMSFGYKKPNARIERNELEIGYQDHSKQKNLGENVSVSSIFFACAAITDFNLKMVWGSSGSFKIFIAVARIAYDHVKRVGIVQGRDENTYYFSPPEYSGADFYCSVRNCCKVGVM